MIGLLLFRLRGYINKPAGPSQAKEWAHYAPILLCGPIIAYD